MKHIKLESQRGQLKNWQKSKAFIQICSLVLMGGVGNGYRITTHGCISVLVSIPSINTHVSLYVVVDRGLFVGTRIHSYEPKG